MLPVEQTASSSGIDHRVKQLFELATDTLNVQNQYQNNIISACLESTDVFSTTSEFISTHHYAHTVACKVAANLKIAFPIDRMVDS